MAYKMLLYHLVTKSQYKKYRIEQNYRPDLLRKQNSCIVQVTSNSIENVLLVFPLLFRKLPVA